MTGTSSQKLTPQEYLAIERAAGFKSEFFDGEMFAMAVISKDHSRITVNLTGGFHAALRGKDCEIFSSDLRVKVNANGLYTYPDLTIVCGPADVEDEQADVLLNPTLIIEILSPGTERYDRGKKFDLYRELESLKEYVLVSQDQYRVEQFLRGNGNEWGYRVAFNKDDIVEFLSVGCSIPLKDIYERVVFPPEQEASPEEIFDEKKKPA
ncbi:MAG: Uma2 family endonuclease [Spartobacteria bacterium]